MARRTSQGVVDGGSTLPSGAAQPDLPPVKAWGKSNLDQRPAKSRSPNGEWVLYATQPKTLSPADPCNKVHQRASSACCGRAGQRGTLWLCRLDTRPYAACVEARCPSGDRINQGRSKPPPHTEVPKRVL